MDTQTLVPLLAQVGLPITLVVFFVYWARDREARIAIRLDVVQDRQFELQRTLTAKNIEIMKEIIDSNKKQTAVLERVGDKLELLIRANESLRPAWDGRERRGDKNV